MTRERHFILSNNERRDFQYLAKKFDKDHILYADSNGMSKYLSASVKNILPKTILSALDDLKSGRGFELITISNFPVDENLSYDGSLERRVVNKTRVSEVCLLGVNSILEGCLQEEDSSHQLGFIHQVTPVEKFFAEASGRGGGGIPFHAENMFVKKSPTFLSLFCLQGEVGVATEYLYVSDIIKHLSDRAISSLKKSLYTIVSGDGFERKQLEGVPVIDDLGNGWTACRFYEEDRIFSGTLEGQDAIRALHRAIVVAKGQDTHSLELTEGTLLLFANAISKNRCGGVLHGRRGDMSVKKQGEDNTINRWLQRVCVELEYR